MQYWRRQLAGAPVQLELPADRARPAAQTFEADVHRLHLTETQTDALKRLGREHDATLFMVLLAALGVLLSKYSGQDDVLVGTPIAHRRDPRLESLIGLFVNTLVMRVRVQPRQSFAALLAEVRRTAFDAFQYADVPFERLVAETGSSRSLGAAPLVQVSFAMQNAEWTPPALAGLRSEQYQEDTRRQRLNLEVYAAEQNGRIGISCVYSRALFDGSRIERMMRHYVPVDRRARRESGAAPVRSTGILTAAARRWQLCWTWNADEQASLPAGHGRGHVRGAAGADTACDRRDGCRRACFVHRPQRASQAPRQSPDRARHRSGRKRRRRVSPRSLSMIEALLGVFKAGEAYLPINPAYPHSRMSPLMLADARPAVVVTTRDVAATLPAAAETILSAR